MRTLNFFLVVAIFFGVSRANAEDSPALFEYKRKTYTVSDLPDHARQAYFDAERRFRIEIDKAVNQYLVREYIKERAKELKIDEKKFEDDKLKVKDPTEAELKKFYDENKAKIPYEYKLAKEELKKHILQEETFKKQEALLAEAKAAGNFKSLLKESQAPTFKIDTDNRPEKGNPKAKVTVVEFADFHCPHCRQAFDALKTVFPRYKDKIRFVYMDFPLRDNSPSVTSAQGGYCAFKQNKFWEYHDQAFANQDDPVASSPSTIAKKIGLDKAAFDKCVGSDAAKTSVVESKRKGMMLGVTGTPGFFVNGKRVSSDIKLRALTKAIDEELK